MAKGKGKSNEENKGRVLSFHHLKFWVTNAKTAASFFITRLGFKPLAIREAKDDHPVLAHAVQQNKITIVFESPTITAHPISKDLDSHGDFVKDVAFEVQDLDELVRRAKQGGAVVVTDVTEQTDEDGKLRYAVLKTYGNNTHTLLDLSEYNGSFLPGFTPIEDDDLVNKLLPATNLLYIDHVEGNMADGTLEDSTAWYERNLNMRRFWCVDYTHDLVPYSGINSTSVINQNETVLLSLNEGATDIRPANKASQFVKSLGASGVEHVALYTDDIISTMRDLETRGAEIMPFPAAYYDLIKEKLKASSTKVLENIDEMKKYHILIDFDDRGYMLQAFIKHVQPRPTLFIEVLQRRNHKGFGAQNYKWVFEAIELQDNKSE